MSTFSSGPWSGYMAELYASRRPPQPLGTVSPEKIEAMAKEKLKDYGGSFMYAGGSAGTNKTYENNLKAFSKYGIKPKMLVDAVTRSIETTIFGKKYPSPLLLAPIGVQGMLHPDGEEAAARAAAARNIPYIMSSASTRSIEDVAAANGDGDRWYQLYWPLHDEVTLSLLQRAEACNFTTLVVTTDTMLLGWRPHDLDISFIPFVHSVGCQVGRSDPVFMKIKPAFPYDGAPVDKAFAEGNVEAKLKMFFGQAWLGEANFRTWEDLEFLKKNWKGKIVLKGIQTREDAEKAIQHGLGLGDGRLTGLSPSLYALESISKSHAVQEAKKQGFTVMFDSGIRTGPDILKAVAIGADAVLLGRPFIYGLTVGGQEGVEQVIRHTLGELDNVLGLSGYPDLMRDVHGKAEEVLQKIDL
ncbi:oxidoreductase [Flagelloscypha sp. PMI_526]|nr:oxidoreductase [Flagelloscypha sp. PMI_526]